MSIRVFFCLLKIHVVFLNFTLRYVTFKCPNPCKCSHQKYCTICTKNKKFDVSQTLSQYWSQFGLLLSSKSLLCRRKTISLHYQISSKSVQSVLKKNCKRMYCFSNCAYVEIKQKLNQNSKKIEEYTFRKFIYKIQ